MGVGKSVLNNLEKSCSCVRGYAFVNVRGYAQEFIDSDN